MPGDGGWDYLSVDEAGSRLFVSHSTVVENVPTQQGSRTLALDTKTHHIYLPGAEFNPAPAATADNPRPRRTMKPNSFVVLDVAPVKK